ncbi:MAG: hypothetical protein PHC28_12385 [Flavobacterium sp.]|uniref:hypothetical protein n=1 Tax=Flavobacterium sp. TaxID=239 RepID=UPI00260DC394|nr:hypothetical protein [Flavobacterium sp.]MDD5151252.1 hypothetical protein [Flavobacterium sp.]
MTEDEVDEISSCENSLVKKFFSFPSPKKLLKRYIIPGAAAFVLLTGLYSYGERYFKPLKDPITPEKAVILERLNEGLKTNNFNLIKEGVETWNKGLAVPLDDDREGFSESARKILRGQTLAGKLGGTISTYENLLRNLRLPVNIGNVKIIRGERFRPEREVIPNVLAPFYFADLEGAYSIRGNILINEFMLDQNWASIVYKEIFTKLYFEGLSKEQREDVRAGIKPFRERLFREAGEFYQGKREIERLKEELKKELEKTAEAQGKKVFTNEMNHYLEYFYMVTKEGKPISPLMNELFQEAIKTKEIKTKFERYSELFNQFIDDSPNKFSRNPLIVGNYSKTRYTTGELWPEVMAYSELRRQGFVGGDDKLIGMFGENYPVFNWGDFDLKPIYPVKFKLKKRGENFWQDFLSNLSRPFTLVYGRLKKREVYSETSEEVKEIKELAKKYNVPLN